MKDVFCSHSPDLSWKHINCFPARITNQLKDNYKSIKKHNKDYSTQKKIEKVDTALA